MSENVCCNHFCPKYFIALKLPKKLKLFIAQQLSCDLDFAALHRTERNRSFFEDAVLGLGSLALHNFFSTECSKIQIYCNLCSSALCSLF